MCAKKYASNISDFASFPTYRATGIGLNGVGDATGNGQNISVNVAETQAGSTTYSVQNKCPHFKELTCVFSSRQSGHS